MIVKRHLTKVTFICGVLLALTLVSCAGVDEEVSPLTESNSSESKLGDNIPATQVDNENSTLVPTISSSIVSEDSQPTLTAENEIKSLVPTATSSREEEHAQDTNIFESTSLDTRNISPNLIVQNGSVGSVTAIFSANGEFILTSDTDATVRLWDTESGLLIREINNAGPTIALSPDGSLAATSNPSGYEVFLWDTATGEQLSTLSGHQLPVNAIDFSPDGSMIATGASLIKLWDTNTKEEIKTLTVDPRQVQPLSESIMDTVLYFEARDIEFSPNGKYILSGHNDAIARLWDIETGSEFHSLKGHLDYVDGSPGIINSVAFSPDGQYALTGSGDYTSRIWDINSGQQMYKFQGANPVKSVDFAKDGEHILVGENFGGIAQLWNIESEEIIKTYGDGGINSVTFSPDGQSVLLGYWSFDIRGRTVIDLYENLPATQISSAQLYDRNTGEVIQKYEGLLRPVEFANPSTNQQFIAISSPDVGEGIRNYSEVQIWDLNLGRQTWRRYYSQYEVDRLAYIPESDDLIVLTEFPEIINSRSGINLDANIPYRIVEYSQNGERWFIEDVNGQLLVVSEKLKDFPEFLDQENESIQVFQDEDGLFFADFSPDGTYMVTGHIDYARAKEIVKVWETDSLELISQFGDYDRVLNVDQYIPNIMWIDFHPTETILVTGGRDSTVRILDFEKNKEIWRFDEIQDTVYRAHFAPNGSWFAVSYKIDGEVVTFDSKGLTKLAHFKQDGTQPLCLEIPTDSKYLITCSRNNLVQFWDPISGNEIARIAILDEGNWLIVDPNTGRFDTNNLDIIQGLHWVFPDDPYRILPIEIFMRDFFTPSLLQLTLSNQDLPEIISLENLNRVQPIVEILSVEEGESPDIVDVVVQVSQNQGQYKYGDEIVTKTTEAYDLRLFRNGQLVNQYPEINHSVSIGAGANSNDKFSGWRESTRIDQETIAFQVRLPHRETTETFSFSAYAFNEDRVKSKTDFISYEAGPSSVSRVPKAYVIVVGVGNKQSSRLNEAFRPLFFAGDSAERMGTLLPSILINSGEFESEDIVTIPLISNLLNEDSEAIKPTKNNIKTVFSLLAGKQVDSSLLADFPSDLISRIAEVEPTDSIFIFFSSHGYTDPESNFYLIPFDSGILSLNTNIPFDQQITSEYLSQSISSLDLANWLQPIDAGNAVLIIDACRSESFKGQEFKPGPMGDSSLGQLAYDKGMLVLAATQGENDAIGLGIYQLSLLTTALVEGASEQNLGLFSGELAMSNWFRDALTRVPDLFKESVPEDEQRTTQQPVLFDFTQRISNVTLTNR